MSQSADKPKRRIGYTEAAVTNVAEKVDQVSDQIVEQTVATADEIKKELAAAQERIEKKIDSEMLSLRNRRGTTWRVGGMALAVLAVGYVLGATIGL